VMGRPLTGWHTWRGGGRRLGQHAKLLELRAAISLSRLWQQQGKRIEVWELLAPIYGWFSEGFDTSDLQKAKALMKELGGG
jgi:predicted ATPase